MLVSQTGHKYSQEGKVLHGVCNKSGAVLGKVFVTLNLFTTNLKVAPQAPLFSFDVLYVCAGYREVERHQIKVVI